VGTFEVVCGSLIMLGLLTRLAVIPTTIIMLVAITTTKVPMLHNGGFWKMAHEARVDYAMLLGSLFLLIAGAGRWSVDRLISRWASADNSSLSLVNESGQVGPAPDGETQAGIASGLSPTSL
jgi:hypothetical protein